MSAQRTASKWIWRTAIVAGLTVSGPLTAGMTGVSPVAAAGCVPMPTGLVGWWPGDPQVTNFAGMPGTLKFGTTVVPGLVGQAFRFDGVDDYVDVGPGFDLDDMTLETWVNVDPATNTGERLVISTDSGEAPVPGNRQLFALKSSTSELIDGVAGKDIGPAFEVWGAAGEDRLTTPTRLTAGWHHLAGVRDTSAGRFELYVDGVLVAQQSPTGSGVVATQVHTVLGTSAPAPFYNTLNFKGLIDEAAIFNRALSVTRIAAIHAAGSAGKCVPVDVTVIAPACTSGPTGDGPPCSGRRTRLGGDSRCRWNSGRNHRGREEQQWPTVLCRRDTARDHDDVVARAGVRPDAPVPRTSNSRWRSAE